MSLCETLNEIFRFITDAQIGRASWLHGRGNERPTERRGGARSLCKQPDSPRLSSRRQPRSLANNPNSAYVYPERDDKLFMRNFVSLFAKSFTAQICLLFGGGKHGRLDFIIHLYLCFGGSGLPVDGQLPTILMS